MDRGLKISLAAGVLLVGAALALMFRQQPPVRRAPPGSAEQLMLRGQPGSSTLGQDSQDYPINRGDPNDKPRPSGAKSRPTATILTPLAPAQPPPALPHEYPRAPRSDRWGTSIGIRLPALDSRGARRHFITDGDTLESLAERYLGDAARAEEIHQANRGLITSPDVLPIGVEIAIPPRDPAPPAPLPEDRPLVPVGDGK